MDNTKIRIYISFSAHVTRSKHDNYTAREILSIEIIQIIVLLKGTTCLFDYCTIIESFRLCYIFCIACLWEVEIEGKIFTLNLLINPIQIFIQIHLFIHCRNFNPFWNSLPFTFLTQIKYFTLNTFKILARVAFSHISKLNFNIFQTSNTFFTSNLQVFFSLCTVLLSNQISNSTKKKIQKNQPKKNTTVTFNVHALSSDTFDKKLAFMHYIGSSIQPLHLARWIN